MMICHFEKVEKETNKVIEKGRKSILNEENEEWKN